MFFVEDLRSTCKPDKTIYHMVFKGVHQPCSIGMAHLGGVTSNITLCWDNDSGIRIYFTLTPFAVPERGDWDAPQPSSFRHSDLDVRLGCKFYGAQIWMCLNSFFRRSDFKILRHTDLDVPNFFGDS